MSNISDFIDLSADSLDKARSSACWALFSAFRISIYNDFFFSLRPVYHSGILSRVLIGLLRAWKQGVNLLDSVVHHSGPFTGASNLYSDMFIKYDTIVLKTDQQQ